MDGIDLLRQQALARRNAAILKAKREYHAALKEINKLRYKLGLKPYGRPRKATVVEDPLLRPSAVAREILLEGKAMSIAELAIEAQRRGCRSLDDVKIVAHAIRNGLRYHRRSLKKDENGRWSVAR
jgi:hypothetical protein